MAQVAKTSVLYSSDIRVSGNNMALTRWSPVPEEQRGTDTVVACARGTTWHCNGGRLCKRNNMALTQGSPVSEAQHDTDTVVVCNREIT
jgi:hypothetical protein